MNSKSMMNMNGEQTFKLISAIGIVLFPNMKSIIDKTLFYGENYTEEEIENVVLRDMFGLKPD